MKTNLQIEHRLTQTAERAGWRRAFAKRIDMTLKRAQRRSAWVARRLNVSEPQVGLWRAGVLLPNAEQCRRLSVLLQIDLQWLCAGDSPSGF